MKLYCIFHVKKREKGEAAAPPFAPDNSCEILIKNEGDDIVMVHPFVWMSCFCRPLFKFLLAKAQWLPELLVNLFFSGGHRLITWKKHSVRWPLAFPDEILQTSLSPGERFVAFSALQLASHWEKGGGGIVSFPMYLQGKKSLRCHVHRGKGEMLLLHNREKMRQMKTVQPNETVAENPAFILGYFCPEGYIPPLKNGLLLFGSGCRLFLWKQETFPQRGHKRREKKPANTRQSVTLQKKELLPSPC